MTESKGEAEERLVIDWPKIAETAAIASNLIGVILLFRYGMPYRVSAGDGRQTIRWVMNDQAHAETIRLDRLYSRLGKLGLALVVSSNAGLICMLWI